MKGGARPGARIGRFHLERLAGEGRRRGVWRGRETRSGQPVAIELLDDWPAADAAARAGFGERLAAVARLEHPLISAVLAYGIEDGTAYVVSGWTGPSTLASLVPRRAPRPSHVRLTLGALASALAIAHEAGVPHLDLQPGNVGLDSRHRVQLSHFLPVGPPLRPEVARSLGAPPAYWPPELSRDSTAGSPADAYGLGLLLYELAHGAPVIADDAEDPARRRLHAGLPSLAEAVPGFARTDIALCTLCDELLGPDPKTRPSLAESAERLLAGLGGHRPRNRTLAMRRREPAPPAAALSSPLPSSASDGGTRSPASVRVESSQPAPGGTGAPSGRATWQAHRPTTLAVASLVGAACILTVRRARRK